jgi:hypothetical protein
MLPQSVSAVLGAPVCFSSSMSRLLSWMSPLYYVVACSDLSFVSWELLIPGVVSVPTLPP